MVRWPIGVEAHRMTKWSPVNSEVRSFCYSGYFSWLNRSRKSQFISRNILLVGRGGRVPLLQILPSVAIRINLEKLNFSCIFSRGYWQSISRCLSHHTTRAYRKGQATRSGSLIGKRESCSRKSKEAVQPRNVSKICPFCSVNSVLQMILFLTLPSLLR